MIARTEAMTQKMEAFTDAGLYEQDEFIDFLPEGHIYLYRSKERRREGVEEGRREGVEEGRREGVEERQLLPVSNLVGYFFEPFDGQRAALRRQERYGIPAEQTLREWKRVGRMASEVGTFLHEQTENYFRDGRFETRYMFRFEGESEEVSVEPERQHFMRFVTDYHIRPYRQEWPVYDVDLNVAGTIDMICQEDDGEFVIYDWKRSRKVVDDKGRPIVTAYGGKMSLNGISVPDTSYCHYCLQQNLYRYMLQQNYGIRVKALNLVVLCADYDNYRLVPVPLMDDVVARIVNICKERDLGHNLLHGSRNEE